MFDRILVALDGSAEAQAAGRLGLRVAAHLGSEVTAVSVIDVRVVEGPAVETLAPLWGEVTGRPFQPELLRLYRERADATLDDFSAAAENVGVPLTGRTADIGIAEEAILERAQHADLVVMGRRGEHAGFGRQAVGATLWRVLHHAPCPILVGGSQPDFAAATAGRTGTPRLPLVAWDCSAGSRAALDLAVRYAMAADAELRIVHGGDESCDAHLHEAHGILADAGAEWESARLDLSPADAVSEATTSWGADCLFMGAFGRGRLRDFLFGSHTGEILEAFEGPVFVTS